MTLLFVTVLCAAAVVAAGCSATASADSNSPQIGGQPGASGKPGSKPASSPATAAGGNPVVLIETSMGTMKAELWADKAPLTVANFLRYTDEGYFNGLIFHRVIPNFMIQGGGFMPGMKERATHEQIKNEAKPELRNDRGTLAMARTGVVDSATSQFFINLKNNDFLNQTNRTTQGFGYCAFGKVIEGMDVADKIAQVKTGAAAGGHQDVPTETVEIKSIKRAQ
jgi:cyclophilin family peptidyl-prolyl cis-trans isomerase